MKSILKAIPFALVLFGLTVTEACKKGENDPAISLKSRKGRLKGEWKLTSGEVIAVFTISGNSTTTTTTYDGSNETIGSNTPTPYTLSYKFEKDGTYTSTEVLTRAS